MKPWFRSAFTRPPQAKSQSAAANTQSAPLVALQLAGLARWTPRDYAALAREGYQRNAPAYRCIRMIAEAAASVPLCVRRDGKCLPGDPASKLLGAPNPKISRAEFFEAHYGYLQLSGNAYLEAVLVDDMPAALFTLPPHKMSAIVGANGWPSAWQYDTGGRQKRFAIDTATGRNLLHHMRLFHPTDDIYGYSPLEAAASAVDIHNAGGLWTKSLLDNSARPSGALVYNAGSGSDRLSDEQFTRLKDELESGHSGAHAAGRPLLLEGGLDWKAMSLSPSDMDFINARREAAREIALAFGVPPMLLGIPGDNTYANYKEANLAFWRQTILPLVRKTADSLEGWLRPWFGDDLEVRTETDDVPALSADRLQTLTALNGISFLSDAEKRERAGLVRNMDGEA